MLEVTKNSIAQWLRGGPESDVIVSSRVRLARNIEGYAFLPKAGQQEVARIEELLHNKIVSCDLAPGLLYYRVDRLDPVLRQLLVERHLMGKDHADSEWVRGVAFGSDERLSLMVNEEDHLRIQMIYGGFQLERAWQGVNEVDDILAQVIPYAFSAQYGYLTACPTNVGTGMRASAMVHLPALVMAREMDKVVELAQNSRLALRGLYGEGTHASADLYQVSNQVTLGLREEEIVEQVSRAALEVASLERQARESFLAHNKEDLRGRINRALGMLASASTISSEEALHLLSQVRLGVELDLLSSVCLESVNELMLLTLPAHLQTIEGSKVPSSGRDELRARCVKERLGLN